MKVYKTEAVSDFVFSSKNIEVTWVIRKKNFNQMKHFQIFYRQIIHSVFKHWRTYVASQVAWEFAFKI